MAHAFGVMLFAAVTVVQVFLLSGMALEACRQLPPPSPVPPDADSGQVVDASPDTATPPVIVVGDASPTSCAAGCAALAAAGCQIGAAADCPTFLARDLGSGKVANQSNGKPLTCADVAAVRTKAAAQKIGFACQ